MGRGDPHANATNTHPPTQMCYGLTTVGAGGYIRLKGFIMVNKPDYLCW